MSLAIVGSRNFSNYSLLEKKVLEFITDKKITTIVSGGAKGADHLAELFARAQNLELHIFLPDWKKYDLLAGPVRNSQIIEISDYLIAFPSRTGRGTQDSIKKAQRKGIPVMIHYID